MPHALQGWNLVSGTFALGLVPFASQGSKMVELQSTHQPLMHDDAPLIVVLRRYELTFTREAIDNMHQESESGVSWWASQPERTSY